MLTCDENPPIHAIKAAHLYSKRLTVTDPVLWPRRHMNIFFIELSFGELNTKHMEFGEIK